MLYHIQKHGECAGTIEAYSIDAAMGKAAEDHRRSHGLEHDPVPIRATLCARIDCARECEPGTCGECSPETVTHLIAGLRRNGESGRPRTAEGLILEYTGPEGRIEHDGRGSWRVTFSDPDLEPRPATGWRHAVQVMLAARQIDREAPDRRRR